MTKKLIPLLLLSLFVLGACSAPTENKEPQEETLSLVATTYPIYLFLSEVTRDAQGVTVTPLINQSVSCLHDYTLTVNDMKVIEGADVLVRNGAGLDDFVLDATHSNPNLKLIDCSSDIALLPSQEAHEDAEEASDAHDHDDADWDPHYWLDPDRAATMLQGIANQLTVIDPANADLYQNNAKAAAQTLRDEGVKLRESLSPLKTRELITFHDGFSYFAKAFDLNIVLAVEEEEGQEASAQVISHALALIQTYKLPAIFTEQYSSDATAKAIAREAGVSVHPLTLLMSGPTENPGISLYLSAMEQNVNTILEALS